MKCIIPLVCQFVLDILIYLLLRRPVLILFPSSPEEEDLHVLRKALWQERIPLLRRIRITLPQHFERPLSWRELIVRFMFVLMCVLGEFFLTRLLQ